jgi:hypothetical protein
MRFFAIISTLALLLINVKSAEEVPRLHDEYNPNKWPKAQLELSQAATLKDVFDSGLRPYAHPGLENSLLEVKHLNLSMRMGSGKLLPPIQAEVVNITPFKDGEIATIEGFTPRLTIEQAREEMLKWLPHAENQRTEVDLDKFLEAVEADFLDFDDPYRGVSHGCGIGWNEPEFRNLGVGPKCGVGFRKTASETHPLRLYFGFDWGLNRPQRDRGTYRPDPIPPPPGYEHISMKAPDNFGPDSEVEIMRSKGNSIGESPEARRAYEETKKEAATERPEKRQLVTSSKLSDTISEESAPFPWWLIACSVAILAIALVAWLKSRKSKSTT